MADETNKWAIRLAFAAAVITAWMFVQADMPSPDGVVAGGQDMISVSTDKLGSWPCPLPGDLDCDCDVDIVDVMRVAALWGDRCE